MSYSEKKIQRFLRHLSSKYVVDSNGCWIWTSKKDSKNKLRTGRMLYGLAWFSGRWRRAHRVVKALTHGPISLLESPELICCHTCDNPLCVNPDHIFLGTYKDNNRDRAAKGRNAIVEITCPHCKKKYGDVD